MTESFKFQTIQVEDSESKEPNIYRVWQAKKMNPCLDYIQLL